MRILALDSAVGRCSVTLVSETGVVAEHLDTPRGQAGVLAAMVQRVLGQTDVRPVDLDLIAVTVGPGSFTGIRSGIALARGLALAAGVAVVGVTIGEALTESLPFLGHRTLWTALPSRPGRVFIETAGSVLSVAVTDLPTPEGPVAVAGTAALDICSRLAARGANVMLTDARLPGGPQIAEAGAKRLRGELPPRAAVPLYVDAPEAKPSPQRTMAVPPRQ